MSEGIKVPVGVDNAAFKTGLNECREYAKDFAGEVKGMFVGAFAVGAVIEGFKSFVEEMAKVEDRAKRFGETTETIQRVGYAAKLAGADMDLVARALSKITIASGQAATGGGEMSDKWEKAGLEAKKFASLGMQDQLIELSEAWEKANGNTEKQVAIMGILGNRAQDLIPLLSEGPEGLKEKMAEASVASDSTVKAMKNLEDSMISIKNKSIPVFGFLVNAFQTLGEVWIPRVVLAFLDIYEVGVQNFKDLGILAQGLGAAIYDALHGNFHKAAQDWKNALREMDQADKAVKETQEARIKSLGDRYDEIWNSKGEAERNKGQGFDPEAGQEAAENVKKLAALKEQIAKREQENALALMDYEHKRLELQKEIAEAQSKSNDTTVEGLEAKKTALELQEKLSELEKRHSEEQAREKERHDNDLARAQEAEAKVDERNALDQMSPEQKRAYWLEKQKKLLKESADAAKRGDDVEAIQKRTQAKEIQKDLLPEKIKDEKDRGRAKITASSLASVGGGGYVAKGSTDPLLRAQEKSNNLLARIAKAVEVHAQASGGSSPAPILSYKQ
jgi:chemotaxis protein histidine kinase CheA